MACQTRWRGALKSRVRTISRSDGVVTFSLVSMLNLACQIRFIRVHPRLIWFRQLLAESRRYLLQQPAIAIRIGKTRKENAAHVYHLSDLNASGNQGFAGEVNIFNDQVQTLN